jgi:hypothetical protein
MSSSICNGNESGRRKSARRIDAVGWGLFFIWIGIALLVHIGWGVGLIGVGIIILGGQVIRKYSGLKVDGFGVVIGFLFFLGGIWELLNVRFDLTPILCVVAGVALLVSVLVGKTRNHTDGQNHTLSKTKKGLVN